MARISPDPGMLLVRDPYASVLLALHLAKDRGLRLRELRAVLLKDGGGIAKPNIVRSKVEGEIPGFGRGLRSMEAAGWIPAKNEKGKPLTTSALSMALKRLVDAKLVTAKANSGMRWSSYCLPKWAFSWLVDQNMFHGMLPTLRGGFTVVIPMITFEGEKAEEESRRFVLEAIRQQQHRFDANPSKVHAILLYWGVNLMISRPLMSNAGLPDVLIEEAYGKNALQLYHKIDKVRNKLERLKRIVRKWIVQSGVDVSKLGDVESMLS